MKTRTNFRARVMKYAWQIFRATRQAWRECMLKAWQLYKLAKAMRSGTVRFTYRKTDGRVREAEGTLANVPSGIASGKRSGKPAYKTMTYFDTARAAFRSFRVENLISVALQ